MNARDKDDHKHHNKKDHQSKKHNKKDKDKEDKKKDDKDKDDEDERDDDNNDRCDHSEFKSWQKLKSSSIVTYVEDETSITVDTDCKIKLHKDFTFETQKDLILIAQELEIKKDSSLRAKRLLLNIEDKFKLKKDSLICADVFILEADKIDIKGEICPSAALLGSSFNAPSVQAVLEVSLSAENAPVEATFDWSKSFGLFDSATIDFGDGSFQVLTESIVSKTYEASGSFAAKLILETSGGEVESTPVVIVVNESNPIVDFGIWHIIRRGGVPPEVWLAPNLYPLVEEGVEVKEYRWNFGDNSSLVMPFAESPDGFVVHTFPTMGIYDVEVEVVTMDGFSKKASLAIDLNNPSVPVPKYSVSSFKGESPLTVTFTGEAYDEADETITYNWFFYDTGEQFFGEQFQQVTHTFTNPGVNYVYLETRDNLRGRRITYIPIYVGDAPEGLGVSPVAIVESTARFGEGPLTVDFSGVRSFDPAGNNEGLSFNWNFGDFRSGELNQAFTANAQHTFNYPGSYFVNLVVTNADGLQHSEFTLVSVDGTEVNNIDFEIFPTSNPYEFVFSSYGYFDETDYLQVSPRWAFGDGTFIVNEPNVTHQYQSTGAYDVELKLRRPDGDYDSYTRRLVVGDNQTAAFAQIQKQSEWFNLNQSVQMRAEFTEGAASAQTTYRWSMGDGTVIKGQGDAFKTIVHSYNQPGGKNIKLTITDDNGLTNTSYSYIGHNQFAPELDGLSIRNNQAPAPVTVAFAPFETVRDLDGNFAYFIYEFGDGSPSIQTIDGYQEHLYQQAGTYKVAVTVVDSAGLSNRYEEDLIIKENQAPVLSDFNIYYSNEPAPALVGFEAWPYFSDVDGFDVQVYEYVWGDGSSEIANSGYNQHRYEVGGNYNVSIRAQDNLGKWSAYITKTLSVRTNLAPVIAYVPIYGQPNEPAPTTVAFAPHEGTTDDEGVYRWTYDFADGSPLLETDQGYVEHLFTSAGTFNVTITAYDFYGLSDSFTTTVLIKENQAPVLSDFNLTIPTERAPVAVGLEVLPFANDTDGNIALYEVKWGNGQTQQNSQGYFEYTYEASGEFHVSVRAQDNYGLWSEPVTKIATILGNQPPLAKIVADKTVVLIPNTIRLSALESSDPEGDLIVFEWTLPDGSTTNEAEFDLELVEVGEQTVTLKVTDSFGADSSASIVLEGKLPFENSIIITKSSEVAPVTLLLEAKKIYDNDGNPLTFEWFVDDKKKSVDSSFSVTINEHGPVNIQLVSIDDDGLKYLTEITETIRTPPLYFTLNQNKAYVPAGSDVTFQLKGIVLESFDYQVEIASNNLDTVIENVDTSSFRVTSTTLGIPIEIVVTATNGSDFYERRAVIEFVAMQQIFNQRVADVPQSVEYQGETLMQVSSPVDGNIFVNLGDTSVGQMIVEVSSSDVNPKPISILGLNPNYSVTASQFTSSFHTGENIGAEKTPINDLTRDWIKVCHTTNPDSKRTIFKFSPDITPDLVDPVYTREFSLSNGAKVKLGFRSSLESSFLNIQGQLDESSPIIIALKNALDRGAFDRLVPIWVLSENDPFLNTKELGIEGANGYVVSHMQVVHVFKEAILREGSRSTYKDYFPFFLLAHEYRHIEQFEGCNYINNLEKLTASSIAVVNESGADLFAMRKVASMTDNGVYAQINEYKEIRSEEGINNDLQVEMITNGLLDTQIDDKHYTNELFFDLLKENEFQFVRKIVENSANTSNIPLLPNYMNAPGYDYPLLVKDYLSGLPYRYTSLGLDLIEASVNPVGLELPSKIGPYGFGYLRIDSTDLETGVQANGSFRVKVEHDPDVKFVSLDSLPSNAFKREVKRESYQGGTIVSYEMHRDVEGGFRFDWDGYFGVLNNYFNDDQKFRVISTEGVCFKNEGVYVPWLNSCSSLGEPLIFSSTYEKPWQFNIINGFDEAEDLLYYLNSTNNRYEPVPKTYSSDIPVYIDNNQLVTNLWGKTYKIILLNTSQKKLYVGTTLFNTGNYERILESSADYGTNLSIDRGEDFEFSLNFDVPWERHPTNALEAKINVYATSFGGYGFGRPATFLYALEVVDGKADLTGSFIPIDQPKDLSVSYEIRYELTFPQINHSYGLGNFENGITPSFVTCATNEAFSRVKRRCGKTVVSEFIDYQCAPVEKIVGTQCTRWVMSVKRNLCDASVVNDCGDPLGSQIIQYCEGFDPPPPSSVTKVINVPYHDFQAEQDAIYSLTCNFNIN